MTSSIVEALDSARAKYSNKGRWGEDDRLGTLNYISAAHRRRAANLVRGGRTFSLALPLNAEGPQNGFGGRFNPIHVMTHSGADSIAHSSDAPHGYGWADDMVIMPLQAGTHWDGLGHIFDNGCAYNGRDCRLVCAAGDTVTGVEHQAAAVVGRAVLLDVGHHFGVSGVLPDGTAITEQHLDETIRLQGDSAAVGEGDIVLIRTGQLGARLSQGDWGEFAGGPAPGLSFQTLGWFFERKVAAVAVDTWGAEVRPYEFVERAAVPFHQIAIPQMGLLIGEMFMLDELASDNLVDGVHECLLVAPPIPVTGAVGAPTNPLAIK